MLTVPKNGSPTFTVMGLDPGTHNLGLGVLHVDALTLRITSFEAYTLVATKMMSEDDWLAQTHGFRFARLDALEERLVQFFEYYNPLTVACEDAYYSRRTPGAYGPLIETINMVLRAVRRYSNWIVPYVIESSVAKKAVGAVAAKKKGKRDKTPRDNKTPVRDAMLEMDEFKKCYSPTPISTLSEHAIDALAIAFARLEQMR